MAFYMKPSYTLTVIIIKTIEQTLQSAQQLPTTDSQFGGEVNIVLKSTQL